MNRLEQKNDTAQQLFDYLAVNQSKVKGSGALTVAMITIFALGLLATFLNLFI